MDIGEIGGAERALVRTGAVTAVDGQKARVRYDGLGFDSGWLYVLRHFQAQQGARVLVLCLPAETGDGFILGGL